MRPVMVGRQDGAEQRARPVPHAMQKGAARITCGPVIQQVDSVAILKRERRDIDGIARRVFAIVAPPRYPTAIITAEMIHADHALTKMLERHRLDDIACPQQQCDRYGARWRCSCGLKRDDMTLSSVDDRALISKACAAPHRDQNSVSVVGAVKRLCAGRSITPHGDQFCSSGPSGGMGQLQRRKGIMPRVHPQPMSAGYHDDSRQPGDEAATRATDHEEAMRQVWRHGNS